MLVHRAKGLADLMRYVNCSVFNSIASSGAIVERAEAETKA